MHRSLFTFMCLFWHRRCAIAKLKSAHLLTRMLPRTHRLLPRTHRLYAQRGRISPKSALAKLTIYKDYGAGFSGCLRRRRQANCARDDVEILKISAATELLNWLYAKNLEMFFQNLYVAVGTLTVCAAMQKFSKHQPYSHCT